MKFKHINKGAIAKKIKNLLKVLGNGKDVLVGLPKDSNDYPDGTSVVEVAITNEFGGVSVVNEEYSRRASEKGIKLKVGSAIRIPERSFMRTTIAKHARKYKDLNKKILISAIKTAGKDLIKNLNKLGEIAKQDIQDQIVDIKEPANSARTIAIKGSDNPLVDSNHLKNSITFEVRSA